MNLREALDILHRQGRIRSPSMDGMVYNTKLFGRPCRVREHSGVSFSGPGDPDTSDAATIGCLASLAREASGDPTLHVSPGRTQSGWGWSVEPWDPQEARFPGRDTEGAAWEAALIMLAEEGARQELGDHQHVLADPERVRT